MVLPGRSECTAACFHAKGVQRAGATMGQTTVEAGIIEHIAQEQLKFEIVFEEQARVLRADQARCDAAMKKIQQTPLVAKHGQHWEPTQDTVDEYLAYCEDICRSVPQNFDELGLPQGF